MKRENVRGRGQHRAGTRLAWAAGTLLLGMATAPVLCPASAVPAVGSVPPVTLSFEPISGPASSERPPRVTLSLEPISETAGAAATPQKESPAPAVPPPCATYAIDLETALRLAGADNPTIALAREAVAASRADLLRARALLLPTLEAGSSLDVHRGNLQSAQGNIVNVDRQSLYVGAGASAVGAGTVTIPGVRITAQVAEAVFEPRAARQQVAASNFDALAVRNRVLLDVTTAYFALLGAEAQLQALRQSESDLAEVVRLTANFARVGQGRQGDADRARSQALLLHAQEQAAEGQVAVAAADLTRLLDRGPSVRLSGPGGPVPLVQLVDPNLGPEALIEIALHNRPEVAARTADIGVVTAHLREEQVRPLVPLLSVGCSAGEFGGGSNQADTRFGHFDGRSDFDVLAVWTFENFGVGNLATVRRLRAEVGAAAAERVRVIDRVRREVGDAYALSAARSRELEVARRRVQTTQEAYRLDLRRTRNVEGHPIEVLNSMNLLTAARQDLVRALAGFDQAQFQLFVALGQPPSQAPPQKQPCP